MTLTIFGVRVLHFSALVGVGWALAFSSLGHDCLAKARIVGYSVGCRLWLLCRWVPRAAPSPAGRLPAGDGAYEVVHAASSAVNLPLTCSSGASSSRSDSSRHAVAEEYVLPAVSPGKNYVHFVVAGCVSFRASGQPCFVSAFICHKVTNHFSGSRGRCSRLCSGQTAVDVRRSCMGILS